MKGYEDELRNHATDLAAFVKNLTRGSWIVICGSIHDARDPIHFYGVFQDENGIT